MSKLSKTRNNKMKRLSTMIDPMIALGTRERGFAFGRLLSHWPEIAGNISTWCCPANISFPKGSRSNGTLKLKISSGRGPQAQAMSPIIIDRVNANFGYKAIERISLVQAFEETDKKIYTPTQKPAQNNKDIWSLDEKLKYIKSPNLRAALRRLGSPIDRHEDIDETVNNISPNNQIN